MPPRRIIHYGFGPSGPPYVTDGLIFNVDANDPLSYPGSGTLWTDLAGSNDGTLVGGLPYTSPGFDFDGVNDWVDIGSITSANPLSLSGLTQSSFDFWVKIKTTGIVGNRLIDKSTGINGAGGFAIFCVPSPASINFIANGLSSFVTFFLAPTQLNTWVHLVITHETSTIRFYINGTVYLTVLSYVFSYPSTTANARLGNWNSGTGREFNGSMGACKVYNKRLTSAEVLQNFNAQKSQYGL